ncbi:brain-specific serine protease 4-like [Petaurus breviceps papuanus]|uniref:brain-specific serine protease 4-like n=1 Tax=Petaurus breviceps papuanus TaxID=3040969 RepID=UPI0036D9CA34
MDKNLGPASQATHSVFVSGTHNSYHPGPRALSPPSLLTMGFSSYCWGWFRLAVYLPLLAHSVTPEIAEMPACGKPQQLNRIVGGENAMDAEWPWIVSIQKNGTHHCAGSLITNRWVVTAAHCFKDSVEPSQFSVLLGAWQLGNPGYRAIRVGMAWVLPHPKYIWKESNRGDIALVRLDHSIKFSERILPICLPDSTVKLLPGTSCWIAGWGSIGDGVLLPYPQTLQKLKVPIISSETCSRLYWQGVGQGVITSDMLCAGYLEGKKDACLGDSGGPLMCEVNGSWLLAGIISWGEGCAERNRPGVYISLTAHKAWIQRIVQGAQFRGQPRGDTDDFRLGGGRGGRGYRLQS